MSQTLRTTAIAAAVAMLTACVAPPPTYFSDNKLRAERFDACLKNLPAGPQTTRYNDWDEVVDSCESAAYYQSRRCVKNCPGGAAND